MDQSLKLQEENLRSFLFFLILFFFPTPTFSVKSYESTVSVQQKKSSQGLSDPWDPIFCWVRPEGGGEGEEVPEPQEPPTAPEEDEVRGGGLTGRFF